MANFIPTDEQWEKMKRHIKGDNYKKEDLNKTQANILKSKNIDAEFVEAPGEHTWEFCDKHIKEFIKTL